MRNAIHWIWFGILLTALLLTGCRGGLPALLQTDVPTATQVPTLPLITSTPVVTPTHAEPVVCAYVWSNKELPDVAQALSRAYHDAKIANVDVRAGAYGENCLDTNTNQVVGFSAMQTDFYLTVPVENPKDTMELGDWVARLVPEISQIPPGQLVGRNPGNIAVQFKNSAGDVNLWFPRKTAEELIQKGLRGSDLYEALSSSQ